MDISRKRLSKLSGRASPIVTSEMNSDDEGAFRRKSGSRTPSEILATSIKGENNEECYSGGEMSNKKQIGTSTVRTISSIELPAGNAHPSLFSLTVKKQQERLQYALLLS